MPIPSESLRGAKHIVKRGTQALTWGAVGEIAGHIISAYISDAVIPDELLAHAMGTIFGAIGATGLFSKFKTPAISELDACLDDANRLFLKGTISEAEHLSLRQKCLDKFK
jgi:hypothetical protein